MEFIILTVLIILAAILFALSGRQKRALRNRREQILQRMRERQYSRQQNEEKGT